MRTWPAIDVGLLQATATSEGTATVQNDTEVWAGVSRPDLFLAALTEFSVVAIDERASDSWRVFFQTAGERDRAIAQLRREFPGVAMDTTDVADDDWAARSQASLHAIRVGDIIVAPPWDVPEAGRLKPAPTSDGAHPSDGAHTNEGPHVGAGFSRPAAPITIVIQPSMGFGTGHHATTRLCLAALQAIDLRRRAVLDIGTGSGVLAIAASLLGASPVIAIDDDRDAIDSARENLELNPAARVDLRVADLKQVVLTPADVVLANLTGGLLRQAAAALLAVLATTGHLILSGLMQQEESDVLAAYPWLRVCDRAQEDEWICVTLQREGAFQ